MNLIPLVGTDEVTFGTHEQKIIELFGKPPLGDYSDTLSYGTQHYSVAASDRRLIEITVVLSFSGEDTYPTEPIFLWGIDLAEYSSRKLLNFLCLKRSEEQGTGKEHDGDSAKKLMEEKYRDHKWDIEVLDDGIVIIDIDDGYWIIEVPECGITIECLGDEVECITIHAVGD
jgi:hypothetical protein